MKIPTLYTVEEVSKILKRHPKTIYRWLDEGCISYAKIKTGYLIEEHEVKRLIKLQKPASRTNRG